MSDELDTGIAPKLNQLETQWSLLRRAHAAGTLEAEDALRTLVLRYAPAIHGYVRMLTRNHADADELSQDVVVRLLKGDFSGADPQRGRFRDLLMVASRNMLRNYWERMNRAPKTGIEVPEASDHRHDHVAPDSSSDEEWLAQWRATLIEIAMAQLEQYQADHPGNVAYTALQLRSSFPELDSSSLATRMSELVGREISAATYRQHLKRGRVRFTRYLVEEIAQSLDAADPQRLHDELIAVGLYEYVRDVLPEALQGEASGDTT